MKAKGPLAILILVVHFAWLILIKFNVYAIVHYVVARVYN